MTFIPRGGGAILAGGKSARMGRDKGSLKIEGRTLMDRCADALRPIASPLIVVAAPTYDSVPTDCRLVADLLPGTGPVGGIVTALDALGEGWHTVVACDMPFLQTDLLRLLLGAADDDYDVIVPCVSYKPEPLCAVYSSACLPPFRFFLQDGGRAVHKALESVRVLRIEEAALREADPELLSFVNLNTPEDAVRWIQQR